MEDDPLAAAKGCATGLAIIVAGIILGVGIIALIL